uniref:Uncharacterized protein n=1 Tax=Pseudomonas phage Nican01 TaxID=3138540 RepID=A0AAU6W1X0_9CAUD
MKTLKELLMEHMDAQKVGSLTSSSEDLAVELVKLEMEQKARDKKKAAEEKAAADMVRLEKVRIEREAAMIKADQEAAAQDAYQWMMVFSALEKRGMEPNAIMEAIRKMQEAGHTGAVCLEMIEKTEVKPPVQRKPPEPKPPPRPEAFGTWA